MSWDRRFLVRWGYFLCGVCIMCIDPSRNLITLRKEAIRWLYFHSFATRKCWSGCWISLYKHLDSKDPFLFSVFNQTKTMLLHSFFWVIPRRLNFMCRHFGILCSIFIGSISKNGHSSETSTQIQTQKNHPKERIQYSKRGEILKTRKTMFYEEYSYYTLRHSLKYNHS